MKILLNLYNLKPKINQINFGEFCKETSILKYEIKFNFKK